MKGEEWKRKALGVIPPRLVLGTYREIFLHIHLMLPLKLKREYFTLEELEDEMKDFVKKFEPGHIILAQSERCIKILPETVRKLKEGGLLVLENGGRYRKNKDFYAFWTVINQVHRSAEKMLRWAVYYLLVNGRDSFSTEELLQVLTYSKDELTEALPNLTIRVESGWGCVVEKHGEKWTIEQSLEFLPKPSLVSDIYDKLLFGISLLSEDSRNDFVTDEISNIVHASEREDAERILRRLHFQKHGDIWKLPTEIRKNPESVIERIELPLRLSPGFAASQCLSLLDANSLSLTELSEITKVDKSTISRTLKRLSEADLVVLMKRKGPFGELYYITNCDNCPFEKDKQECRSEAVKLIEKTMKELVPGLTIPEIDWQRFSNHSLRKLATELDWVKVEKDVKADIKDYKELCSQVLRLLLSPILDTLEKRAILIANEHGWVDKATILSPLDEKGKMLPFLYFLGVKQTIESNFVSAALELLSKEREK